MRCRRTNKIYVTLQQEEVENQIQYIKISKRFHLEVQMSEVVTGPQG